MSVLVMNGHWIFKKPSNQKEFDEIQKKQEELMGFPKKKKDSGISSLASDLAKITKSKKVSNTKVAKVAATRPRNPFILYSMDTHKNFQKYLGKLAKQKEIKACQAKKWKALKMEAEAGDAEAQKIVNKYTKKFKKESKEYKLQGQQV